MKKDIKYYENNEENIARFREDLVKYAEYNNMSYNLKFDEKENKGWVFVFNVPSSAKNKINKYLVSCEKLRDDKVSIVAKKYTGREKLTILEGAIFIGGGLLTLGGVAAAGISVLGLCIGATGVSAKSRINKLEKDISELIANSLIWVR